MSKIKKITAFVICIIAFSFCSKSEEKKQMFELYDTRELIGTWKIVPSYSDKILFEKNQKTFLIHANQKTEIYALEDARGLRLQFKPEDDNPFGYFLFTEKTKSIWGGVLDNKIVRIVREERIPESILE